MKKYLFILLGFISVRCNSQSEKITPLTMLSESDTIKHGKVEVASRIDYFLIDTYPTIKIDEVLKEYINKKINSTLLKLDQYDMVFYGKSSKVNVEYITSFPEGLRYKAVEDEKPLRTYTWFKGKLVTH